MKKKFSFAMILFIFGSIAAVYVIYAAGKEAYRGRKIEKEIETLRQQAQLMGLENKGLQEKISYLDTDEFREKIAKEKLNLKKEDERVVEVRPMMIIEDDQEEETIMQPTTPAPEVPNYRKWWNQFFSL